MRTAGKVSSTLHKRLICGGIAADRLVPLNARQRRATGRWCHAPHLAVNSDLWRQRVAGGAVVTGRRVGSRANAERTSLLPSTVAACVVVALSHPTTHAASCLSFPLASSPASPPPPIPLLRAARSTLAFPAQSTCRWMSWRTPSPEPARPSSSLSEGDSWEGGETQRCDSCSSRVCGYYYCCCCGVGCDGVTPRWRL